MPDSPKAKQHQTLLPVELAPLGDHDGEPTYSRNMLLKFRPAASSSQNSGDYTAPTTMHKQDLRNSRSKKSRNRASRDKKNQEAKSPRKQQSVAGSPKNQVPNNPHSPQHFVQQQATEPTINSEVLKQMSENVKEWATPPQMPQPSQSSQAQQSPAIGISLDGQIEGSVTQNQEVDRFQESRAQQQGEQAFAAAQSSQPNPHVQEFEQKQAAYQSDQQQMFSNMFEMAKQNQHRHAQMHAQQQQFVHQQALAAMVKQHPHLQAAMQAQAQAQAHQHAQQQAQARAHVHQNAHLHAQAQAQVHFQQCYAQAQKVQAQQRAQQQQAQQQADQQQEQAFLEQQEQESVNWYRQGVFPNEAGIRAVGRYYMKHQAKPQQLPSWFQGQ